MPINEIKENGKIIGYRWGKNNKIYKISKYGKQGAKNKAIQQMKAIYASGYKNNLEDKMPKKGKKK